MNIGIIGFGKMGMLHTALLNQIDGIKIAAIAEKTFYMRLGIKKLMPHIRCYNDYKKMITHEQLDAIIICTPTFLHTDIAKFALENGVNVFIEKPLSNNLDSAVEFKSLLIEKKQICMVGYNLRYAPMFQKAKKIIESGQLGEISTINACAYIADVFEAEKGWRYNPALSGGGVVADFTVHMLDLLCWYFGNVKHLKSTTKRIYSLNVEDEASIVLYFNNGCEANVETSWSKEDCRKSFFMIEVTGKNGSLKVTDQTINIKIEGKEPEDIYYPDVYEGHYIDIAGGYYSEQMKTFVEMCRTKNDEYKIFDSAIHVQAVVDAIYASSKDSSEKLVEVQNV